MDAIETKVKKDCGDKYYNKNDYKNKSKNGQEDMKQSDLVILN